MAIEIPSPPKVGMVSLGCPKALVDSERILTRLRADGYSMSPDYAGADVVLVNTCGFLDSAKEESLAAIGEAMAENGRVIVTGCMGNEADAIRARFPQVLAVTGAHQYEAVVEAVHEAAPPDLSPYVDLIPQARGDFGDEAGVKLTPRHYSYLKISEGCNHACSFCIIPSLRGKLASRRIDAVLREAEKLVQSGTRELLVISQDTSAYGVDVRHEERMWKDHPVRTHMTDLARELGQLSDAQGRRPWVRLHYVYPYPHVDAVIPLMAEGLLTPYLDIPFQHAAPSVLKAMKRPANEAKVLERLRNWREICPDIAIRSSFVVGFPGETEADFEYLLDWLDEAQLDRVGAFRFEPVEGASANDLPGAVPEEVKEERYARIMEKTAAISAAKLAAKVGRVLPVIIDEVGEPDEEGDIGATGRSQADAPEIDGNVFLRDVGKDLQVGDIADNRMTAAYQGYAPPRLYNTTTGVMKNLVGYDNRGRAIYVRLNGPYAGQTQKWTEAKLLDRSVRDGCRPNRDRGCHRLRYDASIDTTTTVQDFDVETTKTYSYTKTRTFCPSVWTYGYVSPAGQVVAIKQGYAGPCVDKKYTVTRDAVSNTTRSVTNVVVGDRYVTPQN